MVMPLTGLEELPIEPLMRDATVTNKKSENHDENRRDQIRESAGLRAGDGLELQERPHHRENHDRADDDEAHRKVAFGAARLGKRGLLGADVFQSRSERGVDRRHAF